MVFVSSILYDFLSAVSAILILLYSCKILLLKDNLITLNVDSVAYLWGERRPDSPKMENTIIKN